MHLLKYQFLSSMIVLVSYQNNLHAGSIFVPRVTIVFVSDQNNLNAGSIFVPGVCDMEVYISFLHGKSSLLLKLHRKRYNITNFDLITIQLLIRKYVLRKNYYNESMNLLKYKSLSSIIVLVSDQNHLNAGSAAKYEIRPIYLFKIAETSPFALSVL